MDLLLTLTPEENAAVRAEIGEGTTDAQVQTWVQDSLRHILAQAVARQKQFAVDRTVLRIRTLIDKLVKLTPAQQDEIQALVATAIDERLPKG